jgi:monooxygenase
MTEPLDVLVVGAGLSGIDAGYHLQTKLPRKSFAILEGRERLGGTWDLFRYPGIRSDSDMFTLGFPFRPWTSAQAIASGGDILEYLRSTAELYGIDRKIRYSHRVERARWSSKTNTWTVDARVDGKLVELTTRFLFTCTGYYDYDDPYTPEFPGRASYRGEVVHPQHWSSKIDYTGKRVVVIGSGATAVTLVPALTDRAAHVTMLQRSPTYILSRPAIDPVANYLLPRMPEKAAAALTRWKQLALSMGFYSFCRRYPVQAKKLLLAGVAQKLGGTEGIEHFTPTYNPWDQRLCLVPDADLFEAIKAKRATVVTDHIERFTETGILLRSGKHLDADMIVTATGLKLRWMGGIELEVDGKRVVPTEMLLYRAMMCSGVPNLVFAVGYTNASWTLKTDLVSRYVVRLIQHMDRHGFARVVPNKDDAIETESVLPLKSGYIERSAAHFPLQGKVTPWRVYQNYALDFATLRFQRLQHPQLELT